MTHFTLQTDKPVAFDSPDHLHPHGTRQDNSRNPLFNKKLYALFDRRPLRVLDLGCAGGGFVKSCHEDGQEAVGLEGSDYSRRTRRAEWAHIPEFLFTGDVTADFSFFAARPAQPPNLARFDVVTAWELMEHIHTEALPAVCANVRRHLSPDGLWIMSVADFEDRVGKVVYHQTVRARDWWESFLAQQGFQCHPALRDYFGNDWVRGPLQGSRGFHLVLTLAECPPPALPVQPPYSVQDMLEAAQGFVQRAAAGDVVSFLSLEYALGLLEAVEKSALAGGADPSLRALIELHLGHLAEAAHSAESRLRQAPDDARALAVLEQSRRFLDLGAVHPLYRQLALAPDTAADLAGLEAVWVLRRQDEIASRRLLEGLKAQVRKALEADQLAEATVWLSRFPTAPVADGEWHFLAARCQHLAGQGLEPAQGGYGLALDQGYSAFQGRLCRGLLRLEHGDLEGAQADLAAAWAHAANSTDRTRFETEALPQIDALPPEAGARFAELRHRAGGLDAGLSAPGLGTSESAAAAAPGAALPGGDLGRLIREANQALARQDLALGEKCLRQARAHAPNDPELLVGHGSVLLQMRHTQAACQTFAAAARLAPRYLMAHVNHAVALLLLGEAELAEAAALRAASVDPGHDEVLKLLGHLRLRSLRRPPHVAPA